VIATLWLHRFAFEKKKTDLSGEWVTASLSYSGHSRLPFRNFITEAASRLAPAIAYRLFFPCINLRVSLSLSFCVIYIRDIERNEVVRYEKIAWEFNYWKWGRSRNLFFMKLRSSWANRYFMTSETLRSNLSILRLWKGSSVFNNFRKQEI